MTRIFSPMKSDVELTFGFSCSIVATGTPVSDEITPKVSPAFTVQNVFVPAVLVVVLRVVVGAVVTTVCGEVAVGTADTGDADVLVSSPFRTRMTAIVTPSRNAAGAV